MRVLYRSPYLPAEWFEAHGCRGHRLVPTGAPRTAGVIPEREGLCPFLHAFMDEAAQQGDAAALVLTTFCDQVRRIVPLAEAACPFPVYLFDLPVTCSTANAERLYRDELIRLSRFLVSLGAKAPGDDALRDALTRHDRKRTELCDRIGSTAPPDTFACLRAYHAGDPLPTCAPCDPRGRTPIALLGGPLMEKDTVLLNWIDDAGGLVVLDATETGERTLPAPLDYRAVREDPFGELVRRHFSHIPDVFRRPNAGLFRWVTDAVRERAVRGVVLLRYVWCDAWHAEVRRFRDCLDVPILDVDLNREPPGARARTRIEAFLENLP